MALFNLLNLIAIFFHLAVCAIPYRLPIFLPVF